MLPYQKIAKACKAMKPYGFRDCEVKAALKGLLEMFDNNWELIQDENYKVLLDYILEPKTEEDERMKPKRKGASSQQKAKGVNSKKKESLLHCEPQVSEPPSTRLRSRHQKEQASASVDKSTLQLAKTPSRRELEDVIELSLGSQTCSEPEDFEPQLKRKRSVDKSTLQLAKTPSRREPEDVIEVSSGSQTCSEPEDSEPQLKRKRLEPKKEQAYPPVCISNPQLAKTSFKSALKNEAELFSSFQPSSEPVDLELPLIRLRCRSQRDQTSPSVENSKPQLAKAPFSGAECDDAEISKPYFREERAELTQLYIESEQVTSKPVSSPKHLKKKSRKADSSQTCLVVGDLGQSQPDLDNKRAKSKSVSLHDKGKTPVIPQVAPGERELGSEEKTGIVCYTRRKIEPSMNLTPTENVLDLYYNNFLDVPRDESFTDDKLDDEVPLAAVFPDPQGLLCGDGSSHGNSSDIIEDGLIVLEFNPENVEDKGNGVSDSSQIDIASSPKGEVKIALICNSSHQSNFHTPSVDAVLRKVEEKCIKSYKIMDPSFSVLNLMREFCECYFEMGTSSADDGHVKSMNVPPIVDTSEAQDIPDSKGDHQGFDHIPLNFVNGSVKLQNLIEVVPQITKIISPSWLDGLHCIIGSKSKDIESICGESERRIKIFKGSPYLDSCSMEPFQKHQSSLAVVKPYAYIDDITRAEERVKISLVAGSGAEELPAFFYIPQNLIYNKASVNFALARIADEDCCSQCSRDCLSSAIPCTCARQTGGEFAYTPGGLIQEKFLEECISLNGSDKGHIFYCKNCPLERSKNKTEPNSCKGHLVKKFIKECWSKCGCSKKCGNRVVQRGISVNLQVFPTPEGKGWGLRTIDELPKGAFVCEYAGEIVTNSEFYNHNMQRASNEKHMYPVLLDADWGAKGDLKDEEALFLDGTVYGNVARIINHRCSDATLIDIPIEVETPDHHYYHVAFFTTRKVAAMEELTWDYGIDFDDKDHPVKAFKCLCGSSFCRDINR